MYVTLGLIGEIKINHVGYVGDVETARRQVGRNHHAKAPRTETGECRVALSLRTIAMNGYRSDMCVLEHFGDPVGAALGSRENDRALDLGALENLEQHLALLFERNWIDRLAHRHRRRALFADRHARRIV